LSPAARKALANAAGVLLAFGLLGLALYQNRVKLHEVLSRPLDWRLFAAGLAVYLVGLNLTFLRWYFLVRVVEPRFRIGPAYILGYIGNVFNLVVPGAVGGDFFKAAYLVRMEINRTQAVASMVIDRILGLLGLFLLAGVAGAFAWPLAPREVRALIVVVWAAAAGGFLVLALIFNQGLTRSFPGLLEGHGRVSGILRELTVMSGTYRRRLGLVAGCLLSASVTHGLFVMAFYAVSRALFRKGLPTFADHLLMVPLTLFTTAVPLPFGALGLTENISARLFDLVGHPGGALAMMGFRVLMYGGGLVSLSVYLANLRQVRSLTASADHLREDLASDSLSEPENTDPPEAATG